MAKIGVVGLGFMGITHIKAYANIENADIAAVADADEKKAGGDLSDAWGNIGDGGVPGIDFDSLKTTTDYRDLLAMDDLDIVDICVPTPFHLELVTAALESGKHVVCEKPLARTAAEARSIAAAAERAPGMFMPAMCLRFWPEWQWLKEAVEKGTYGKVLSATFRRVAAMPPGWYSNGEWSGGALLDLHIHDTDFVCWLFGRPDAVNSSGFVHTSGQVDHVATQYIYRDESLPDLVTAEGGWCMDEGFGFNMQFTVNFEKATADYDMSREHHLTLFSGGEAERIDREGDGWEGELRYFVEQVTGGGSLDVVSAADAARSIEVIEAEGNSVASGEITSL